MRPVVIVLLPPVFYNGLSLFPVPEDFTIQALIPQLIVEALNIAILPWAARIDEQSLATTLFKPLADCPGYKLRPIVTAQVPGYPMRKE